MKKLLILAAMAATTVLFNTNPARAQEDAADKTLSAEEAVVKTVKKSVDERIEAIESVVNARKARITKLEGRLGNVESEAKLGALARTEIYAKLEQEHAANAKAATQLDALLCAKKAANDEAKQIARRSAARSHREITKVRKDLNELVARVKELGALDAAKAQELGKLIGRVAATEEATKANSARLDAHDKALGDVRNELSAHKEETKKGFERTEALISGVADQGLHFGLALEGGASTGYGTPGWSLGLAAHLQKRSSPIGLRFGLVSEVARDGSGWTAAGGKASLLFGEVASPVVGTLNLALGVANDRGLDGSNVLFVAPTVGALVHIWKFVHLSAEAGRVAGQIEGWVGTVNLGVDLISLASEAKEQQANEAAGLE